MQTVYTLHIYWKRVSLPTTHVFSSADKRNDYAHQLVSENWPDWADLMPDMGPWEILEGVADADLIEFDIDECVIDCDIADAD